MGYKGVSGRASGTMRTGCVGRTIDDGHAASSLQRQVSIARRRAAVGESRDSAAVTIARPA